ncbi:MAG: Ig-like domain-containing protein [Anaerolineae bacterium]|nr:Ig-like domain-containing protein [Anaerolineae bacterium]
MMRLKTLGALFVFVLLMSVGASWAQETTVPLNLIDVDPLGEWAADQPVTLTFDRPLDCSDGSVTVVSPADAAGETTCAGNALTFTLTTPLERGQTYRLIVDGAQGEDGAEQTAPVGIDLLAQSALQVTSFTPSDGQEEVATTSTVTVAFNRPVVPLVSLDDQANLPSPITFDPPLTGTGVWLNTSIYQFTPDPVLPGGQTIIATVDGLTGIDGAPLEEPFVASFLTVTPQVIDALPAIDETADIETAIQMRFNQPIDQSSLESAFYLRESGTENNVSGEFTWSEDGAGFSFQPDELLALQTSYEFGFDDGVVFEITGRGTVPAVYYSFLTVPLPSIINTYPLDGATNVPPYDGFVLTFNGNIDPENLLDFITIDPAPEREPIGFYSEWSNEYSVSFGLEAQTDYTISVAPGISDRYGNTIDTPLSFSFRTRSFDSELSLNVPRGEVGIYDADRAATELFVTYRNVEEVNLQLSSISPDDLIAQLLSSNYYNITDFFAPSSGEILRQWSVPGTIRESRMLELVNVGEQPTAGETVNPNGLVNCPDAMPSITKPGDIVTVITEPDPLRVRSAPQTGEIIDLLYRGYQMPVLSGPTCLNGIAWWEVTLREGQIGWVAEGLDDEYFFEVTVSAGSAPVVPPSDLLTGGALPTGAYLLQANAPELEPNAPLSHIMVVTDTALVLKHGVDNATVWATDLHTGQPLAGLPVELLYPAAGFDAPYALSAVTNEQGLATFSFGRRTDLYTPLAAAVRTNDRFGLVVSRWEGGLAAYNFAVEIDPYPRRYSAYLYTDRPVYRPGQTVYFRGIIRQDIDNDYPLPDLTTVPVTIRNSSGETVSQRDLTLSAYGTFTADFPIDDEAELGYYQVEVTLPSSGEYSYEGGSTGFDVAAYRLPEFEVSVDAPAEVVRGGELEAEVSTRYFFGGAVNGAKVDVYTSSRQYFFNYTGSGRYSFYDYDADGGGRRPGDFYNSISDETDEQGVLSVPIETERENTNRSEVYLVEASVSDSTGFFVSGRTEVVVHQAEVYVGVTARDFVANEGAESIADLIVVDWDSQPVAGQEVNVEVVERRWNSIQTVDPYSGSIIWQSEVEEIPVTSGTVTTGADGTASFAFTPPTGGIYKITGSTTDSEGREAVSSNYVWASGSAYVPWRVENSTAIELIADQTGYSVGDTAEILITSPFSGRVEALVTVERSGVIKTERLTLESNSTVYRLPIELDYAPTVYVSVLLVKGVDETNPVADFRMGLIRLPVDNAPFRLDVDISADRSQAAPQETITYTVHTSNEDGLPVQTELGVGLTDLATLSLREPYNIPLLDYFYGGERLGLLTAGTLTLNTDLITQFTRDVIKGGGGGGGGDAGILELREEFVDTPFWNGQLETNADGIATFSVDLPDNLTTWRLDVRALSAGGNGAPMLVGQATDDLLSTKPLIIRPVAPRFFVAGDEPTLAAVVNNNTDEDIEAEVTLIQTGLTLDSDAVQTVTVPARSTARVEWAATVEDVESVELVYSVDGGGFQDATRPAFGQGDNRILPVYRFEVQEFVGTGGALLDAATRVESVSLPTRYPVTQGDLTVRVEPSLAISAVEGVRGFRTFTCTCTEAIASRLLANLAGRQALLVTGTPVNALGIYDREINLALQRLAALQKVDGGWGWYQTMNSDGLTSAWVMLALTEANAAGFAVDSGVYEMGAAYLLNVLRVTPDLEVWQMNRAALMTYALTQAGRGAQVGAAISNLYDFSGLREGAPDNISLYGQALLMMAMQDANGSDPRLPALRDSLMNAAVITANGAQWSEASRDRFNWGSDTRTTAIVLKALVGYNASEPLLPNAVRWLMVARRGDVWESTQETAWALDTLVDWMVATNENAPDYTYSVTLNGDELTGGQMTPDSAALAQVFTLAVGELNAESPNPLVIDRGAGDGALYYTAYLNPFVPVSEVDAVSRGFSIDRAYRVLDGADSGSIESAESGQLIEVTLTLTVANPAYYVVIEDPIPAGTEPVDTGLATNQQTGTESSIDDPTTEGEDWWLSWWVDEQFRDEKVVISADYIAPGTYAYRYVVRASVPGIYNVIPSTAYETYFPEVYGRSAGDQFTVTGAGE